MAEEYVPLASEEDVVQVLGRALTSDESARVNAILAKASELFRRRSGQQFTTGTSTVRLKSNGGEIRLPQRPAVAVQAVTLDDGTPVEYDLFGSVLTTCLRSGQFARVTYTHGGAVPDVVRLCIAEIAKKVLTIDPNAVTGKTQHGETAGPFSSQDTYATWAQGGQTMLAPDDAALADSFRVKFGGTIVLR